MDEFTDTFERIYQSRRAERAKHQWNGATGNGKAKTQPQPDLSEVILSLDDWLKRNLAEPDLLLGHWLTTTSRVLLNAPTGIGKSMFLVALLMASTAAAPFLHWKARRPSKALFIDGEMSRRLFKERLGDEVKRSGLRPQGFYALSHEDIPGFQPLNTPAGQNQVEEIIKRIGGVDFIGFDNVMCLVQGDHKDEEGWRQTLPFVRSLTSRSIGQAWVHHTGHDTSHGYGTKTREWEMDTVALFEEVKRPDTDVSFKMTFTKARERRPETRADFAEVKVALVNDEWTWEKPDGNDRKGKVCPKARKFYDALVNATIGSEAPKMFGCPTASLNQWSEECFRKGVLERDKEHSARTLFAKHKLELIAANWIAANETAAWTLNKGE